MTTFACKSDLQFAPRQIVNLGAVDNVATTPDSWQKTLGGLALINGTRGELLYKFEREGGAAQAGATLVLKTASGQVLGTTGEIPLPASSDAFGKLTVDLGGISGGSPILCEVTVNTADAGTTARFDAVLSVETPVVIGGC